MLVRKNNVLGTPNLLRLVNRNTILSLLEQKSVTSRAELSVLSGISPPTVSAIVKELFEEGWLHHAGEGVSQGGKPPKLFELNPNARYIGAVQMNQDKIRIRITNLVGSVLAEEQIKLQHYEGISVCAEAARRLMDLIAAQQIDPELVLGVGAAVPGVVDAQGVVSNAPEFGWELEPIKSHLANHLPYPIIVENDVKLAAIGDAWKRNSLTGVSVYIHLDRGIGAGILIDGKLYRGAKFAAGEIGNLIVDPCQIPLTNQRMKSRFGYFEAEYGLTALNYSNSSGCEGNQDREDLIIKHFAYAVVNVVALLDPDTIVFGGIMTSRIENFLGKLLNILSALITINPKLLITPLGDDASLFGVTRAVIEDRVQVTLMV
ncbi:ROK family transcriptional regulator [Paenibacillus aestuarii]|uniref:ROK family protein n=1 Tax=Paenibacillus aestuarii TaxID=516965 RepID=A0ABW0KCQ8_9BACL|nr:ROK family transcriptional regulator [Paenibacillus aestuarii]